MTKKRSPESAAVKKDALDRYIVDREIKGYLNNEKETMFKKMLWEMMYKDCNQPKPKTRQQKKKPKKKAPGVNGRSEKVEKRSSKINYNALRAFLEENAEADGGDRPRDEEAGVEGAGFGGREEEGINDNNDDDYDNINDDDDDENIHGFDNGTEGYRDDGYGGGGYGDDDYGEYDDY